ncbi:hypothetical protein FC70_GL000500 [Paucilactobacillus oligofermentans DSM 15707 = LMG 22743]|uniref:HTH cro/C1-type domain-containing protein n=1 Tax=Paucilactobacillus oligofermentans DSM 15707 = LMG 22743 TaxID=1423778 RepID=A0A0R1RRD8_9LACO|nr:hypothetical protein FC70_GL000500 [Paucilactobacillus oligofermentans DSM 15707 = LMG 22743]
MGPVIKSLRKSKHLTQGDLSKLTGIAQNTISNHENQNRSLDEHDIQLYASALNVTPQDLYKLASNESLDKEASNIVELNTNKPTTFDLADDNTIAMYQGKPISDEDMKLIKRLLRGKE